MRTGGSMASIRAALISASGEAIALTRDAAEAAALGIAGGGTVQSGHGHCQGDQVGAAGG